MKKNKIEELNVVRHLEAQPKDLTKSYRDSSPLQARLRMTKRSAFTLAEVLIVLAIIGVISVLTLPNVMQNYTKKVTVAQLQRSYNALKNGLQQYLSDQMADSIADTPLTTDEGMADFMNNYLSVTKVCTTNGTDEYGSNASGNCLATSYIRYKGTSESSPPIETTKIETGTCGILETGSTICLRRVDSSFTYGRLIVYIDANGVAAPNKVEQDLFSFVLENTKLLEQDSSEAEYSGKYCDSVASGGKDRSTYFHGCFNKIVQDGWQMKYKF